MSLFDLPRDLPRGSVRFLEYITLNSRSTGIGLHLFWQHPAAYKFFQDEVYRMYKYREVYPIEVSLLKVPANRSGQEPYCGDTDFNDLDSPAMKLRFWWAYNLAVAYARQNPA